MLINNGGKFEKLISFKKNLMVLLHVWNYFERKRGGVADVP